MKIILAFLLLCAAHAAFYSESSGVKNLDVDNIDDFIPKKGIAVIEFYAPWCGHCKMLKPEFVKAAKELGSAIPVGAVDLSIEKNQPLSQEYQVQGLPTIIMFTDGKSEKFEGGRTANDIVEAARSKLPNIVENLKGKTMKKFKKYKDIHAVLVHKKNKTPDVWKALAVAFEGHIKMYESKKDKEFRNKYSLRGDQSHVLLFQKTKKRKKPEPIKYDGLMKLKPLKRWLKPFAPDLELPEDGGLPVVHDQSCWEELCVKKGLCVVVLTGFEKDDAERVSSVVEDYYDNNDRASLFGFITIDMEKQREWVEKVFPDKLGDYSHLLVVSVNKFRYATYVGSFSYATVTTFIGGITTGRTSTSALNMKEFPKFDESTELCKPEPVPEPEPKPQQQQQQQQQQQKQPQGDGTWKTAQPGGGSKFLVHPTDFEAEVAKATVPSIVEFYAPWCGHCKQLAPQFARAADAIKGMVQFIGIDCTVEEAVCQQYQIRGYPTLKIFNNGDVSDYQKGRSAVHLKKQALALLDQVDVPEYDSSSISDFKAASGVKVLFFTNKKKIPAMVSALVARYPAATIGVVYSEDEDVCEEYGVSTFPTVLEVGEENKVYEGKKKFPALCEFVESLGAVKFATDGGAQAASGSSKQGADIVEITSAEQWKTEVRKKVGMTILALLDDENLAEARSGDSEVLDILGTIASDNPETPFKFAFLGKSGQTQMMKTFDLEDDIEVDLVIVNPKRKRYAVFEGDFTKVDVEEWVKNVKAGGVKTSKAKKFPKFLNVSDKDEL